MMQLHAAMFKQTTIYKAIMSPALQEARKCDQIEDARF